MKLRSGKVFHSSASARVAVNKKTLKTNNNPLSDKEAANILLSISNKQSSKVDVSEEPSNEKLDSLLREVDLFVDNVSKIHIGNSNKIVLGKVEGFMKFYTYFLENIEEVLIEQDFNLSVINLMCGIRKKTYSFISECDNLIKKEQMKSPMNEENLQTLNNLKRNLYDSYYKLCKISDKHNVYNRLMSMYLNLNR